MRAHVELPRSVGPLVTPARRRNVYHHIKATVRR